MKAQIDLEGVEGVEAVEAVWGCLTQITYGTRKWHNGGRYEAPKGTSARRCLQAPRERAWAGAADGMQASLGRPTQLAAPLSLKWSPCALGHRDRSLLLLPLVASGVAAAALAATRCSRSCSLRVEVNKQTLSPLEDGLAILESLQVVKGIFEATRDLAATPSEPDTYSTLVMHS